MVSSHAQPSSCTDDQAASYGRLRLSARTIALQTLVEIARSPDAQPAQRRLAAAAILCSPAPDDPGRTPGAARPSPLPVPGDLRARIDQLAHEITDRLDLDPHDDGSEPLPVAPRRQQPGLPRRARNPVLGHTQPGDQPPISADMRRPSETIFSHEPLPPGLQPPLPGNAPAMMIGTGPDSEHLSLARRAGTAKGTVASPAGDTRQPIQPVLNPAPAQRAEIRTPPGPSPPGDARDPPEPPRLPLTG